MISLLGEGKVAVVMVIVIGSATAGLRKFTTESRKTILGLRDFLCPRILIVLYHALFNQGNKQIGRSLVKNAESIQQIPWEGHKKSVSGFVIISA